jgi:putative FmdB family regulatory protein
VLTYAYECERCGEFEVEQSIKDPALKRCPQCAGEVERLISGGAGFIMKGGGSSFDSQCGEAATCSRRGAHCGSCGK